MSKIKLWSQICRKFTKKEMKQYQKCYSADKDHPMEIGREHYLCNLTREKRTTIVNSVHLMALKPRSEK